MGDDAVTTNDAIVVGSERVASGRQDRRSRVANRRSEACDSIDCGSSSSGDLIRATPDDARCSSYGMSGMTFLEICQFRLQHLFPQLAPPPPRYALRRDSVESTAECLADDVIRHLLKEDVYLVSRDPVSRSMRHNVYQMLNKHSILFTSMVNRLNVIPETAYEAFTSVADELFLRGDITWARIVCLYAFAGRLAIWAKDRRMYTLKNKLPSYVSRYVAEEIAHFIKGYGGWGQLCVEYPIAEEVSGAIWQSLLMTGATLCLIATILTVTSR